MKVTKEELKNKFLNGEFITLKFLNHPYLKYDILFYYDTKLYCLYIEEDYSKTKMAQVAERLNETIDKICNENSGLYNWKYLKNVPRKINCSKLKNFASDKVLDSI